MVCFAFVGLGNIKYIVHVLDKYSTGTIKDEQFSGKVREKEQMKDKTVSYRVAGKPLARPGRKQDIATEDFDVHISYLLS